MQRATILISALVGIAAVATPVLADDLVLAKRDATPVTEYAVGTPYWKLQAECAGLFGSMSNYQASRGRAGDAEQAKRQGVSFLNDAIGRLQHDRGVGHDEALQIAGHVVDVGRAHAAQIIAQGTDDHSSWNMERSFCLDVNDAYHQQHG